MPSFRPCSWSPSSSLRTVSNAVGAAGRNAMSMAADEARFWTKVIKGPRENDCWLWTGAVGDDGYGRFWIKTPAGQQAVRPQRFAYLLLTGEQLDPDTKLMHSCDIPI